MSSLNHTGLLRCSLLMMNFSIQNVNLGKIWNENNFDGRVSINKKKIMNSRIDNETSFEEGLC